MREPFALCLQWLWAVHLPSGEACAGEGPRWASPQLPPSLCHSLAAPHTWLLPRLPLVLTLSQPYSKLPPPQIAARRTSRSTATPSSAASTRRTPSKTSAPAPVGGCTVLRSFCTTPGVACVSRHGRTLLHSRCPYHAVQPAPHPGLISLAVNRCPLAPAPAAGRVVAYLPPGGPHVRMDSHLYPDYLVGGLWSVCVSYHNCCH